MDKTALKNLRISQGLTQAEMAIRLGVSQEMISEMESGARAIPGWIENKTKGGTGK